MHETNEMRRARPWPLIIMLSMLGLVILAGLLLSPRSEEDKLRWLDLLGTTNHGVLMNPPLELASGFLRADGNPDWDALESATWKLIVVHEGACAALCEDMIFLMHQIHTRLNRRAELLDQAWLNFGDAALNMEQLETAYPELAILEADLDRYQAWISGSNLEGVEGPVILLVNPIDVMQMFYTRDHDGSGLLEDLEHLMKLAN